MNTPPKPRKRFYTLKKGPLAWTYRGNKYISSKSLMGATAITVISISEQAEIIATARSWISARTIDQRTWWAWVKSAKCVSQDPLHNPHRRKPKA